MVTNTDFASTEVTARLSTMGENMGETADKAVDTMGGAFGRLADVLTEGASDAVGKVGALFDDFGISLPKGVKDLVDEVSSRWSRIKSVLELPLKNSLIESLKNWKEWAVAFIDVIKTIWKAVGKFLEKINSAMQFGTGGPMQPPGGFGPGGGMPGIQVGIPIPGGGTKMLEGEEALWEAQLAYLHTIAENTGWLKPDLGTSEMSSGGAGVTINAEVTINGNVSGDAASAGQTIGEAAAAAMNEALGSLVWRENRLAGYVEVS